MSLGCWTPMIGDNAGQSGWNLEAKHPCQSWGPEEKTVKVSKFTEGYELVEAGIRVLGDTDWNEQWVAATRQGIMKILACCEEILKERMDSVSCQTSMLDFLKSSSGTHVLPTLPVKTLFHEEVTPPYSAVCQMSCTLWIFRKYKYIFTHGQNSLSGTTLPVVTLHLWENLSWLKSSRLTS